ncbi:MAG: carboxyltransferase subunit alpha [Peptoniphilaceae bacterium]
MSISKVFEDLKKKNKNKFLLEFKNYKKKVLKMMEGKLDPVDRVYLSRYKDRPKAIDFIEKLIDEPIYLHGDRYYGEDRSIVCGLGKFHSKVVTFIGINKGRDTEEKIKCNFGMVNPEGYRKAVRLMKQAEKFNRPIIIFIDTPGAYPGIGAEKRGQSEAIASSIYEMTKLKTRIISVITGEGSSGGAMALALSDYMIMMENAIYSILSPEGFASILWRDTSRVDEAKKIMKLTSYDLLKFGVIDEVVKEKVSLDLDDFELNFIKLEESILKALNNLLKQDIKDILANRRDRFRNLEWD